jgi:hypothetical protein
MDRVVMDIDSQALGNIISLMIKHYSFTHQNAQPDILIIPDNLEDVVGKKILYPADPKTEELLYFYEMKNKELEKEIANKHSEIDSLMVSIADLEVEVEAQDKELKKLRKGAKGRVDETGANTDSPEDSGQTIPASKE